MKLSLHVHAVNDSLLITDDLKAHISALSKNGTTLVQCTYTAIPLINSVMRGELIRTTFSLMMTVSPSVCSQPHMTRTSLPFDVIMKMQLKLN